MPAPLSENLLRLPDGRNLGYAEFGSAGGRPVIYMHGLPASRLEARIAEGAARRLDIRLISPDRPGIGYSDFQPGRTLADWPEDVLQLADALDLERFSVLGVSGGGPYAIACACRIPQRIRAVGLVGALGPVSLPELGGAMKLPARFSFQLARQYPSLADLLYARLAGRILWRWPLLALLLLRASQPDQPVLGNPAVADILRLSIGEAFRQGGRGAVQELTLLGGNWDVDPGRITCPVFLWHGEEDRTVPVAMGRYLAAMIPRCRARFLPAEGHFSLPIGHMEEILSTIVEPDRTSPP
jgi:pimeloyl-ACP methyl ester carboxylesterase